MAEASGVVTELKGRFGAENILEQATRDKVPTVWAGPEAFHSVLAYLKNEADLPFRTLYDLTAIDERDRRHREGQPESSFTIVYQLLSYERNEDVRIKVACNGDGPIVKSIVDLWPSANWYEREVWDMFGIGFEGHPFLRRILMPPTWEGHPLRKEHPARATEIGPFRLSDEKAAREEDALRFDPGEWGLKKSGNRGQQMFVNMGPQHPGTHGLLRIILELEGEEIRDCVLDIGYHHRGAEKMGERQSWHTYIPYTDRVDYLGGCMNNLPYLLAVEKLAGIEVPDRAKVIRIMMAEFFRIASHLVYYGTLAQDVGAMSPVFYMFNDRERIFTIVEAICGGRMHPEWFRIGGVAQDLPRGWEELVSGFLAYMPARMKEYDTLVMENSIFKSRMKNIGVCSLRDAIDWGVTGPNLRACGMEWDFRKKRPYCGYEQFDFEVPTATGGDCYSRAFIRVEEIRQSLRIIEQCLKNMPEGPYKSDHPLTTPPMKEQTMYDIETLITHFLGVSGGPVIPPGEAAAGIEATKGNNTYYLISDGGTGSYRTRIRTPSFAHLQTVPMLTRGLMVADLVAILGSLDYVLADVDR